MYKFIDMKLIPGQLYVYENPIRLSVDWGIEECLVCRHINDISSTEIKIIFERVNNIDFLRKKPSVSESRRRIQKGIRHLS